MASKCWPGNSEMVCKGAHKPQVFAQNGVISIHAPMLFKHVTKLVHLFNYNSEGTDVTFGSSNDCNTLQFHALLNGEITFYLLFYQFLIVPSIGMLASSCCC